MSNNIKNLYPVPRSAVNLSVLQLIEDDSLSLFFLLKIFRGRKTRF